jgi:hypothetical protein
VDELFDGRITRELAVHWQALQQYVPLRPIRTPEDHMVATAVLRDLLEMGAGEPPHPLAGICDLLTALLDASA